MKTLAGLLAIAISLTVGTVRGADEPGAVRVIVCPSDAPANLRFAARELRRYVYVRTGALPSITETGHGIVLRVDPALAAQQFRLKTDGGSTLIAGGSDVGVLYGAYRYAERLGVRFYLHGDVLPDERLKELPAVDEAGKPLFDLRGINPWGWHPFGMDAWSANDYTAVIAQLAKLRMNFMGIHSYPEGHPQAEPTVWHGLVGDFDAAGRVTRSYPLRYFNTLVGGKPWGDYLSRKTSDYSFGGALLFDDEAWAPDVFCGYAPHPVTAEDCNEVFNRTGAQFKDAFAFARQLGVKTCLGTEAPLTLPASVAQRSRDVRAAQPWPKEYAGQPRLIVPTARSVAVKGEILKLRILVLDHRPAESVALRVRPLGEGAWREIPASHVARAVYEAKLPTAEEDFEYYLTAETAGGQKLVWPATAPSVNQTVVTTE